MKTGNRGRGTPSVVAEKTLSNHFDDFCKKMKFVVDKVERG